MLQYISIPMFRCKLQLRELLETNESKILQNCFTINSNSRNQDTFCVSISVTRNFSNCISLLIDRCQIQKKSFLFSFFFKMKKKKKEYQQ